MRYHNANFIVLTKVSYFSMILNVITYEIIK